MPVPNPPNAKWILLNIAMLVVILTNTSQSKDLILNSNLILPSGLHCATQSDRIIDEDFSFNDNLWTLTCQQLQSISISSNIDKAETPKYPSYKVFLIYSVLGKRPVYLVKQKKFLKRKISWEDLCLFESPDVPVKIQLFKGPLKHPEEKLCSAKGLTKITSAINEYNHKTKRKFRISIINLKLDMFLFDEKNLSITEVFHFVFSN